MIGHATNNGTSDSLILSELWSSQLKEILEDELMGQKYVHWLTEFPHGDQFTIPTIGDALVDDYVEGTAIKYRALQTGEFNFTISEYLSSGHAITDKMKQDSFYYNQLLAKFVPSQARALQVRLETDIFALANQQTLSNLNTINDADHRFVANGSNETIALADFARANYALTKANVPSSNRVAIVDPSVGFAVETLSNLVQVSNNPRWEGIVESGMVSDMKFIKNVYGFDVYESNYLADANETIDGKTTTAGKANLFFSATSDILPFMGAWRQMPTVEGHREPAYKEDRYDTTARYGLALYRPENLVVVLTDTDQV